MRNDSEATLGIVVWKKIAHIGPQGQVLMEVWSGWSRCGLVGGSALRAGGGVEVLAAPARPNVTLSSCYLKIWI